MKTMKYLKKIYLSGMNLLDLVFAPLTLVSLLWLKMLKNTYWRFGSGQMRVARTLFNWLGVVPVTKHYYEPYTTYDSKKSRPPLSLDYQVTQQLNLLRSFHFNDELKRIPLHQTESNTSFFYKNGTFEAGDAEMLYNFIRKYKPRKIIEIGSGFSTLMAHLALEQNKTEDKDYACTLSCVEPYENQWLQKLPIHFYGKKVEDVPLCFFEQLEENDILFIDSSHVIRPEGDVLYEYLHILPTLKKGVLIHIHDVFTPQHYPQKWSSDEFRLWNEQYLLEAFLMFNNHFQICCALNYLRVFHPEDLLSCCPILAEDTEQIPGSFWMKKIA